MSQDVLTPKQKAHFAQSKAAFEAWAENHTPDEIELAIAEINGYVADQDAQIDAQLAYQRDGARQEKDKAARHQQAQLDFVNYHPEFITGEPSATILSNRVRQLLVAGGLDPNETPYTVELLEQAFRELVNEQRIDWNPQKGNPWARVEYKRDSEPGHEPEPLTEEEIERRLEAGLITMEDVRDLANQQLAAQNQNAEVDRAVVANTDRKFTLDGVAPRPDGPVTERQQGFAALAYGNRIHLKQ